VILAYIGRALIDCHRVAHGGIHCGPTHGGMILLVFIVAVVTALPFLVLCVAGERR
jgi:hypothetical protein